MNVILRALYSPDLGEHFKSTYCMMIRPIENLLSSTEVQKHHQNHTFYQILSHFSPSKAFSDHENTKIDKFSRLRQ